MLEKIIVLGLYALVIIIVGIIGLRKTKSFHDFFLGGGNVGPWMSAFSYATAYFSAVVFIGFAGKIGWGFGFSGMWIGVFNALIGVLAVWWLLGWKVKRVSVEMGVSTLSEFLEKRYGSPFMKLFASISIFVFLVPYSAAVFIGLSYLFTFSFPLMAYWQAVAFMAIFTTFYIVMGGYKSMAIIDSVFGMIMIAGVLLLLYFTMGTGGGFEGIVSALGAIDPKLTAPVGPPGIWPLFCLLFLTSVAPFAMPQLVQKFYAIRNKRSVHIGMVASTLFSLLIGITAYFLGSLGRVYLSPEATPGVFTDAGAPIFDALMPQLLGLIVPESVFIVVLLLLLSASMSTLAALVLISSSSLAKDFYAGFIKKDASDKQLTLLMRVGSAFFIVVSVIIALIKPDTIVAILGISWGAIGSAFLGPFIWGLFSKKVNRTGAITAMVGGLFVCIILYFMGFSSPEAGTIGMVVSFALNPIVSALTGARSVSAPA